MTNSLEKREIIVMFSAGYMNWEIAEKLNIPLCDVRKVVSMACSESDLYLHHTGTPGRSNPISTEKADLIIRRIWG